MQKMMIKSHKPGTMYLGECLFILNKGLNSGKPLHEPCANCFVMSFTTQQDKECYYWLSYSLWRAKFWHRHLVGSVIPFLRILDFKQEFERQTAAMLQEQENHLKSVKALQLLELKEAQFRHNLALINDMKRTILYRYIK